MKKIVSTEKVEGDKLYEVTQLLNSLMGIAVLPYEMHKEFFQSVDDEKYSEVNQGRNLNEIRKSVKESPEYKLLREYILELYKNKKWKSTFTRDMDNMGQIKEDVIVFRFLRHIRNVTCHAGDNAISILPLDEGAIISHIIFYDKWKRQEFAMDLTVKELESLIFMIAAFYRESSIGYINKTETIKAAENRVKEILKSH